MIWYAVYTKPRWEKKVATELEKRGVSVYCPLITEVRQWSDRKKKVTTPLFKSFVFVQLPEKQRQQVFEVPGAVRYLFWLGKPAIIRQQEINIIKTWLEKEDTEEVSVTHLLPGDGLIIPKGKLKDHEAVISEIGKRRVKLILKNLGIVVNLKLQDAVE